MRKIFHDDECLLCARCNEAILAGSHYLVYKSDNYCSEECLKNELLDECDYDEEYLMSADDYAGEYADMMHNDFVYG